MEQVLTALMPHLQKVPVDQLVVAAMLVFARVGTCLMLVPGINTARVAIQHRLFLAVAFSFVTLPWAGKEIFLMAKQQDLAHLLVGIVSEAFIGASLGVIAHIFFWAIEFMATFIAMALGFSGQPGHSIIYSQPEAPLANFITFSAVIIFFTSDLYLLVIQGLVKSYSLVPASFSPEATSALIDYRDALSQTFLIAMHIAAPFIIYTALINFAIGLLNKLTPAIPVYFISTPFVLVGGLFLFYLLLPELFNFFAGELLNWLK